MRRITLIVSVCLLAALVSACTYQAGNYPPIHTEAAAHSDSLQSKIIVVGGKKYTCINEDGSWRCVELEKFTQKLQGKGGLDASQQNPKIEPRGSEGR